MRILIIGGGAREHALAWKIRQSPGVDELYCAPGNAGISGLAVCVPIGTSSVAELATFAILEHIDLTVVGPELPLSLGIVDEFQKRGLTIFGASKAAAEIESSKLFAKEFMTRNKIPTASYEVASSAEQAHAVLRRRGGRFPVVFKADGLAAGKGVIVAADEAQALRAIETLLVERRFGAAGERVVIEDCLEGREVSFFALTDGQVAVPLATCQDYKRLNDRDTGPNTGGMGGYSPSVHVDNGTARRIMETIVVPTVAALGEEGRPYQGVLYAGLMLTAAGPKVLEFNARFGDPEAQLILARLKTDLLPALQATLEARLEDIRIEWSAPGSVCVVLASAGYPEKPENGKAIEGLDTAAATEGVEVFHAATSFKDDRLRTSGGRVLTVTAVGATLSQAARRCYAAAERIRFSGKHFRTDIAADALLEEEV
jgi:phosphoribosylamine--glycine ligase